jgi:hypothetical protein
MFPSQLPKNVPSKLVPNLPARISLIFLTESRFITFSLRLHLAYQRTSRAPSGRRNHKLAVLVHIESSTGILSTNIHLFLPPQNNSFLSHLSLLQFLHNSSLTLPLLTSFLRTSDVVDKTISQTQPNSIHNQNFT